MLVLPALPLDCAASVYADDQDPNTYYVVPVGPRIRPAASGGSALVFYKYRSIPPGATEATGGGFLEFQTELVLDDAERARVVALLRGRSGVSPAGPTLRTPTYLDGTAELITFSPTPGGMVEAIEGSTHPSLFADNTAAFALKLSRDGAALLWTQLRTTPSPVAVRYALTMMGRLPPGRVHVWMRSGPVRDAWPQLAALGPGEARTDALAGQGLAGVDVLDWPPAGTAGMDELKRQLVAWGWDLLDQSTNGALTGSGPPPDWTKVVDVDTVLTGRSCIPWPVNPATNLAGSTDGSYQEVDLGDPIFTHLTVLTRCDVDFDANRIHSVVLRLRYGDQHHDAVFTDNTVTDVFRTVVDPRLGRTYTWGAVIQFRETSHTLELPPVTADAGQLLLSVGDVGWVRIDVVGTAVDWSSTDVVEVHLSYADTARGVPAQDDVVVVRESAPVASYERAVWVPVDQPWQYRAVHVLRGGRRVELPAQSRTGRVVVVQEPFARFLTVRLNAPGGFAAVALHVVECERASTDGTTVRESFQLKAGAATATWSVGLLPGEDDQFRYKVSTIFADGHAEQHDWVPATGSQSVAVGDRATSLLEVTVAADVLDYTVVKLAQVSLRHTTPAGEEQSKSLIFQASHHDPQVWTVPLAADDPPTYSWSALFYLSDGSRRSVPATDSADPVLVLQLPPA